MSMVVDYARDENEGALAVSSRWSFKALLKNFFAAADTAPPPVRALLSAPVDYELPQVKEASSQVKQVSSWVKEVAKPLPYTPAQLEAAKKAILEEKKQIWGDVPFIDFKEAVRDLSNIRQRWTPVEPTLALIDQIRRDLRI